MHAQALDWVARYATNESVTVLDLGGRDINGSPRSLFPGATYVALDIVDGPGVDVVADAATWQPDRTYDAVLCCEVFEHTDAWPLICATAHRACRSDGLFVVTTAGPGRAPHSAVDGGAIREGEHYANIRPAELRRTLVEGGWRDIEVDQLGADVRAVASR
jgi:SAM-dependent methyltransferase